MPELTNKGVVEGGVSIKLMRVMINGTKRA